MSFRLLICMHPKCKSLALRSIFLTCKPSVRSLEQQRVRLDIGLRLCLAHSRSTSPHDYLHSKGWDEICHEFGKAGLAIPDRETLEIEFVPVTHGMLN